MGECIYQCINGNGVLLSGNCTVVPCAPTVQGCDSLDEIYTMPCPRPYGKAEPETVVLTPTS